MEMFAFKLALVLLPVPVIYWAFFRYFQRKPGYLNHLESFLYGISLAVVILLFSEILFRLIPVENHYLIGFVKAALIEKTGAYILIYYFLHKHRKNLNILDAMITAMLLGTGFSAVENLLYSMTSSMNVILVRFMSAVPLHAYTCGMIGFFLGLHHMSHAKVRRKFLAVTAFAIPFLFHGVFDTALLVGGGITYMVGPLLVIMNGFIEYMFARAQTFPPADWLYDMELQFEDWETIQREPQYERWILQSMGSPNTKYAPFLLFNLEKNRIFLIVLLLMGVSSVVPYHDSLFEFLDVSLKHEEEMMLIIALPIAYILNILMIGMINPDYFRNSIIRIPIISDVEYSHNGIGDRAITYDITRRNSLFKTVEPIPLGTVINVSFECAKYRSSVISGTVIWDNHEDPSKPNGTIVRFANDGVELVGFLNRYHLFKIVQGVSFNLKLPGFESIRRFFVQPLSVMQVEKRFTKGTLLFREGDEGKEFYLIKKGEVEIFKDLGDGRRVVMNTLDKGHIFGEMAIVGNQRRAASAICKTDCIISVSETDNLTALIKSNPDFALKIIQVFSNRLLNSERILQENIDNIKKTDEMRERYFFGALYLMLLGFGFRTSENELLIKVNLSNILEQSGLGIESILYLFDLLGRKDSPEELAEKIRAIRLTPEFERIAERFKMNIEF